jgi:hypothetical protein
MLKADFFCMCFSKYCLVTYMWMDESLKGIPTSDLISDILLWNTSFCIR